ncbi:PRD domain-containing protein [Amycolatopsis sp. NPDC006131]|uniref:PRD domain-containing protein n=1 Tax=Amycolatopsis sp. NPDC006131 TaxID=3156731 RepID=UPI0033B0F848
MDERLGVRLPDAEVTPLALHFVNAQFESPDLSRAVELTEVLTVVLTETGRFFGLDLDEDSLEVARFITHLRYFARRQQRGPAEGDTFGLLRESLRTSHSREVACADHVGRILRERCGWIVDQDEVLYLALHISRLTAGTRTSDGFRRATAAAGRRAGQRRAPDPLHGPAPIPDTAADDVAIARLPEVLMAVWQGGELHVALWIPVPMACRKVNAELGFQTG